MPAATRYALPRIAAGAPFVALDGQGDRLWIDLHKDQTMEPITCRILLSLPLAHSYTVQIHRHILASYRKPRLHARCKQKPRRGILQTIHPCFRPILCSQVSAENATRVFRSRYPTRLLQQAYFPSLISTHCMYLRVSVDSPFFTSR